jgi:TetR/AcrR family transcriptional regulator, repressor of fatR-cypB operon
LTGVLAVANLRTMSRVLPFYIQEEDAPAKREILRAALKLFGTRGLAATSIRDIADESGYTNPALYKHFASKDDLALYLFETCHTRVWMSCSTALSANKGFEKKLDAFVATWLELMDTEPDVLAFLVDSARTLWPRSSATLHRRTMIGLARTLASEAPASRSRTGSIDVDVAAASIQGTLSELGRMIQLGVVKGPARRWQGNVVALFRRFLG